MAASRVTLRDIAAHVGVHASTVSRVLNPERRSMVSPEVAARVTEAVRSLGYYPNPAAYGLRTNRSSTIGVVVSDVAHPVFPQLIRGIEDQLIETGYMSIVCSSDHRPERKQRIVEIMRSRQLEGMILTRAERDDPVLQACRKDEMPVVLVQHGLIPSDVAAVHLNDRLGTRHVIDHLVSLGHSRIALISGPQRFADAFARHRLTVRAMTESGLPIDPALTVFTQDYSLQEGMRSCNKLLAAGIRFTAIVAGYDMLAVGCCDVLKQHGLACPDDISVVGYNDIRFTDRIDPPLTTVRFDRYDAGMAAASLLLDRMKERDAPPFCHTVPPTLIVRTSTAAACA